MQKTEPASIAATPLVIVGMHRSGTSLVASLLAAAGLDLGANLLGAGLGNPRGHFEDLEFLALHQRILRAGGLDENGYVHDGSVPVPEDLAAAADALLVARQAGGRPWGWKEPRTTLLLDFYDGRLPQARYLCMFRRPWEVVDSLLRRGYQGDRVFEGCPALAARVWRHYNSRILDLVDRHPDRCLLVESSQVVEDPHGVLERAGQLIGVPLRLGEAGNAVDRQLMQVDACDGRAALVDAVCPEATAVYLELHRRALSSAGVPAGIQGPHDPARLGAAGMLEWAGHARSRREAIEASARAAELSRGFEKATAACTDAHAALAAAIEHRDRLTEFTRNLQDYTERLQAHEASQQQQIARQDEEIASLRRKLAKTWGRRIAATFRRLARRSNPHRLSAKPSGESGS